MRRAMLPARRWLERYVGGDAPPGNDMSLALRSIHAQGDAIGKALP